MRKADNLRAEPTILSMEKISFSVTFFSGHFLGQSFIKTVRGPLLVAYAIVPLFIYLYFFCDKIIHYS